MGWSFSWNEDKKQLVERLIGSELSSGYKFLEHKVVGNHLWHTFSRPDGSKSIGLYLLQPGGRSDEGWGYKGVDEDYYPGEFDCPIAFIEQCDPPQTECAREWREKVLQFDARKKELKKNLRPDVLISLWGAKFRLVGKQNRQWVIRNVETDKLFRLPREGLKDLTILSERVAAPAPIPVQETLDLFAAA
ncbi:hypothetical protein SAMN02982919_02164 [Giesbergeria anulus]|uniref:DUF6927 domain-containing protein n=2 Tax=Giesbergeria anulus TaxID=180197 RepID=A0A1H9NCE8_9BURK|nr:hypothetical protein SAMN02982919_02164 [Giesbergeria anulus]